MLKFPFIRKKKIQKPEECFMPFGHLPSSDHEIRPRWRHVIPIPSESLIATVNNPGLHNFYIVGKAYAHLVSAFLPKRARILDVGCGCAKLARFLHIIPTIKSYVGFDVIPENIKWSVQAFVHVNDTRFTFVHANIYIEFSYKVSPRERHSGFISEEVPESLTTKERKAVSPMDIVAVLTKVVQEQQKVIQEQQEVAERQQKTISVLAEELKELKREVKAKGASAMAGPSVDR
jgi:SAM-dependent methyltransferase